MIVANNAFKVSSGLLTASARTTLTFQAKDGRFRIVHTNIEQYLDAQHGWSRVGMWKFSLGEEVKAAADQVSDQLAACVEAKPGTGDDW